jgi:hypothetical protein
VSHVTFGRYLEGQGHSMTLQQNRVQPITSLFEVGFSNYFTEMITILRQCVGATFGLFLHWTLSVTKLWHYKRYTFLCPKPIWGASPGLTGSCLSWKYEISRKQSVRSWLFLDYTCQAYKMTGLQHSRSIQWQAYKMSGLYNFEYS